MAATPRVDHLQVQQSALNVAKLAVKTTAQLQTRRALTRASPAVAPTSGLAAEALEFSLAADRSSSAFLALGAPAGENFMNEVRAASTHVRISATR